MSILKEQDHELIKEFDAANGARLRQILENEKQRGMEVLKQLQTSQEKAEYANQFNDLMGDIVEGIQSNKSDKIQGMEEFSEKGLFLELDGCECKHPKGRSSSEGRIEANLKLVNKFNELTVAQSKAEKAALKNAFTYKE